MNMRADVITNSPIVFRHPKSYQLSARTVIPNSTPSPPVASTKKPNQNDDPCKPRIRALPTPGSQSGRKRTPSPGPRYSALARKRRTSPPPHRAKCTTRLSREPAYARGSSRCTDYQLHSIQVERELTDIDLLVLSVCDRRKDFSPET